MPKKGKKGKKGKKRKKKMIGNETPGQVMKRLLSAYESHCSLTSSPMLPAIKRTLKDYIEEDKLLVKFILEPLEREKVEDPQVCLEPLVAAIRQERYAMFKALYVWDLPIIEEHMSSLAQLLEKQIYQLCYLELMDCLISPYSVERLARSFNSCATLSTVNLDYNEFGDEGCKGLCTGLEGNVSIISLSLCYCDLSKSSGKMLGKVAASTAVREFYLDGNNLECEGTVDLLKECIKQADLEAIQREEEAQRKAQEEAEAQLLENEKKYNFNAISDSEGEKKDAEKPGSAGKKKKKKKGKKKKKKPPAPPPVGPWIYKLHLADNGIDVYDKDRDEGVGRCMQQIQKLILNSKCLQEVDLEDNLIGDNGGAEILAGLELRKEAGLPSIKLRTTHRMSSEIFNKLVKLGAGLKKKKKRKLKKKKK